MRFANRLSGITASPTLAVMQEAQELRARGIDIIDLGPGEPDFHTPERVKEAARRAIAEDFTKYTPAAGIKPLRQAVATRFNEQWGTEFELSNVIICNGAKHAIYNVCMALFQEGDEILNPTPYWVTFPEVIKMTGAEPVDVDTQEKADFVVTAADIEERLTRRSRGLIVNTPNNPTGAVIPRQVMAEIMDLARAEGLFLLFDETYDYFTYGEKKHTSLAALTRPSDRNYAIVGSFSKTYSMTGWRVGYCIGPRELIAKMNEFQSHQSGNPCSVSQKAALEALQNGAGELEEMRRTYQRRRDFVLGYLSSIPGMKCPCPDGAFYAFPNVSECMINTDCMTSQEFAQMLIREARVATVPGSAFGREGYIRLSYATSMENLRSGLERIKTAVS